VQLGQPRHVEAQRVAEGLNRLLNSSAVHQRCQEMARQIRADDPAMIIRNVVHGLASEGNALDGFPSTIETGFGGSSDV